MHRFKLYVAGYVLRDWVLNKRQAMNCSYEPILPMNHWTNKPDEPMNQMNQNNGLRLEHTAATLELHWS